MKTGYRESTHAPVFRTGYWLAHCEGYRVDSPDGRVGVVEHVRLAPDSGRPELLAVRSGLFVPRSLLVPADRVEGVVPRERRVILRAAPQPGARGLPRSLRRRTRAGRLAGVGAR